MMHRLMMLLTVGALAACATAPATVGALQLEGSAAEGVVELNGTNGRIEYAYTLSNVQGQTALCGNLVYLEGIDRELARRLVSRLVLSVDEVEVHSDFRFFGEVSTIEALRERAAPCVMIGVPFTDDIMQATWSTALRGGNRITN